MPVVDLGKVVGDPGASMRFRGEWNSGSEYFNNASYVDTVTHHGSLWVCKQTNTGQEPIEGDYWGIGAYGTETGFDATITIPASGWTGSEPPFAQTVTVSGMTYEKAVVYAVQSDGASPTDKEKAEYAKITGISQNVNSITFYASEKPSTDIVIRAFNGAGTEDAADLSVIAAPFDSGKNYVEGEHCMNEGQMWKFDDAKSSGAWDPSKVTSTTVAKELEAHEVAISALNSRTAGITAESRGVLMLESSFTTDEFGKKAIHEIFDNEQKRIISARASIPEGNRNIFSEIYIWNTIPYIRVKNDQGNVIANTNFNITAFFITA